jgi:ABC-type branched-subunit amino acid transport system substrate-binding protein
MPLMNRRPRLAVLVGLAGCLGLALLPSLAAPPGDAPPGPGAGNEKDKKPPIVVGMSAAFRGPSRGLGIELYRGSMAYFDEVNAGGGVNGRTINVKAYDDGYNPTPAIENTVRLVEKDEAIVLFDYVGTPTTTRVLPLLNRYRDRHVYLFCPFTGAGPMRRPPYGEFVFNLRASYAEETAELVKNFVAHGCTRIAVFYQIDAYGRSGWDGVRKALADEKLHGRKGLLMAGEATYRRGAKFTDSMKEQVDILRGADPANAPDAVICIGAYAACAAFIRDARDAGWDVPIANVSFVGSENLLALLQDAAGKDADFYTDRLINSQVVPSYHRELPAVREYRNLMDKHLPRPPDVAEDGYRPLPYSFVSLEGFLNAKLLVKVLSEVKPGETLKDAAERVHDFDLGLDVDAKLSFGPDAHQGQKRVYLTVVRDGRFVRLEEDDWKRLAP